MLEKNAKQNRIWELDFFRGVALLLMVYFHVVFDLKDLYGSNIEYASGINYYIGKISVTLFMIISGISCHLSRNNRKRGIRVLAVAMAITVVTHLFDPGLGVKFGILHFLGVSMLIFPLFNKINNFLLFIAAVVILVAGNIFAHMVMPNDYLFIFNLTSNTFSSSDYYPLFPWLSIFLFGVIMGRLFYAEKKSVFPFSLGNNAISAAGRHTLIVYIVHQPLILAVLELLKRIKGA